MTAPNIQRQAPASMPAPLALTDFERLLKGDAKSRVEFEPFGSTTKITLSVEIIRKYIAVPAKANDGTLVLPDDRQCMKFLMLCRSRALNPFEGDAFMIPFWNKQAGAHEWSLITSHQAFLKRGEIHPEYDGKRSGIIINAQRCKPCDGTGRVGETFCPICGGRGWYDELEGDFVPDSIDGEEVRLLGGWCRIYFKGRKNCEYQRLSLKTYSKPFGNWSFDAAGMICKCAEAAAMRGAFPTTLGGMYLREEMFNESEAPVLKRPEFGRGASSPAPVTENGDSKPTMFQPPGKAEPPAEEPRATAPVAKPPEPEPPSMPEPDTEARRFLKGVRGLCKAGGFTEANLLDLLAVIGRTDGSVASLDELAMLNPEALKDVFEKWSKPDGYLAKLQMLK